MTNILILEDDIHLTIQWRQALEPICNEIFIAHGATQALELYDDNHVDLCIVDLIVREDDKPKSDGGILFLGKLKTKKWETGKMPLVLGVSGIDKAIPWIEARNLLTTLGASDFLEKPFSDDELVEAVGRLLEGGAPAG